MKNNKTLKTIIPLLIFTVIIGLWVIKNLPSEEIAYDQEGLKFPLTVQAINIEEMQKNKLPIIVDFGADSCVPCKEMAPVLALLNKEMQEKAIIQFVDVWKNPEGANGFPVQVIPTQFFYTADNKPYVPTKDLGIEFTMYSHKDTDEHLFTVHQGGLTESQMRAILADMGVM